MSTRPLKPDTYKQTDKFDDTTILGLIMKLTAGWRRDDRYRVALASVVAAPLRLLLLLLLLLPLLPMADTNKCRFASTWRPSS